MGLPEQSISMIECDVGGGFGVRGEFYPEDFLIPYAARRLGRPVKWIEDRREHLVASNHARDAECELELACDCDGTIRGLRGRAAVDLGAYIRTNGATAARNIVQVLSGPYRVPHIHVGIDLLVTNKTPSGTYRGPGRFEADFFRERLFDMAARDLKLDRVEFRRRNLIAEAEMPYALARVAPLDAESETDTGDYRMTLDHCLDAFKWSEKAALQGRPIDGRYHGLGIGCYFEGGGSGPRENARLDLENDGSVSVYVGSSSVGQGVETVFAQIAADALELPMTSIRGVYHGSTGYVREGFGSYSSRSIVMGGSAIVAAAISLKDKIRDGGGPRIQLQRERRIARWRARNWPGQRRGRLERTCRCAVLGGRHLCEHASHLQLRRACRACRGRSEDRTCRAARLSRDRGRRPDHQSADSAWPDGRRGGAGPRRCAPGAHRL